MQISAETAYGVLEVRPSTPLDPSFDVPRRIQVTDGTFGLVGKGFGELTLPLQAGVYRVVVESSTTPFESAVFVKPNCTTPVVYTPTNERVISCAPVPGSPVMRETFREPLAQAWRQLRVGAPPAASHILLMLTAPEQGVSVQLTSTRVLSHKGDILWDSSAGPILGTGDQYAIMGVQVPPGACILEWQDSDYSTNTRQSLWVGEGWSTILFAGVHSANGRLNSNTLSIYHWKSTNSFTPETTTDPSSDKLAIFRSQRDTELALQSIITGRQLLSVARVESSLLAQKFENPMLGILGCHMLLQRAPIEKGLIKLVLANLAQLVPGHPDVAAVAIMARHAGVDVEAGVRVEWPPMLRAGMAALCEEDWRESEAIREDSLCDRVRARIFSGGVWTRWLKTEESEFSARAVLTNFSMSSSGRMGFGTKSPLRHAAPASFGKNLLTRVKAFISELKENGGEVTPESLQWTRLSRLQVESLLQLTQVFIPSRSSTRPASEGVAKETSRLSSFQAIRRAVIRAIADVGELRPIRWHKALSHYGITGEAPLWNLASTLHRLLSLEISEKELADLITAQEDPTVDGLVQLIYELRS